MQHLSPSNLAQESASLWLMGPASLGCQLPSILWHHAPTKHPCESRITQPIPVPPLTTPYTSQLTLNHPSEGLLHFLPTMFIPWFTHKLMPVLLSSHVTNYELQPKLQRQIHLLSPTPTYSFDSKYSNISSRLKHIGLLYTQRSIVRTHQKLLHLVRIELKT